MPYEIKKTANPLEIKERRYGQGSEIKFTTFTSCIGVIGCNTDSEIVSGVHLSILSDDNTSFRFQDVESVTKRIIGYSEVAVIGCIKAWEESEDGNLRSAFQELITKLKKPYIINTGNGIFGGRLEKGEFEILYKDTYYKPQKLL